MDIESIFNVDTPIQEIKLPLIESAGIRLYIKRDDQIHTFVSGNKWRKLKYNFKAAAALNKNKIATFGGAYSNHLIATAAAGAQAGFKTLGIVRGDELNIRSNYILRLCDAFGMHLNFVTRNAYKSKETMYDVLDNQGFYCIPEGGDNDLGIKGCSEILGKNDEFEHVFVPVGTGTTMSGLMRGVQPKTTVHGVAALNDANYLLPKLQLEGTHFVLHTDAAFQGFGKFDKAQLDFNRDFAMHTGILLDPIYTGKMMRCLLNLIEDGYFKADTKILSIHTGGLTGVLSEKWLRS